MDFALSEEQEAFRETLRRFFAERSPLPEVFRQIESDTGWDRALWKQMASELGLPGVAVPEAWGGQGFGLLEQGIAFEEMGRALVCAPYLSSACLAANALLLVAGDAQRARWLPPVASGETVATLALLDDGDAWTAGGVGLEFARSGGDYVLEGRKRLVTDGASADLLLVAARAPGSRGEAGVSLFALPADARGVRVRALEPLDPTRRLAEIELSGARAELLGEEGAAAPGIERTLDRARVALAAESSGGAQRCLEAAVEYAKQRVQFGRPIGSFQAIKHRCAEMLLEVESARCAAAWGCCVADEDGGDLALAASTAKSFCGDAYERAAADNVHIHGGIGVTWETDAQLHFKRARADATLLGSPAWQRARIAELRGF